MRDYIEAANVTSSQKFYGEMVGLFYFLNVARDFIAAGQRLDEVKKTLFYGRRLGSIPAEHKWGGINLSLITGLIPVEILHGVLGVATESVEMVEAIEKVVTAYIDGRIEELDETNMKEEGGDALWYLAVMFKRLGTDFSTEAKRNIAKLMQRYPAGFTEENALVRDIMAERAVLETKQ